MGSASARGDHREEARDLTMWGHGGMYGDWARFLESWGRGECGADAAPAALAQKEFDQETWLRLNDRIVCAVDERLSRWAKALSAALRDAQDEFMLGRALAQSRAGLQAIRALFLGAGLPADLRSRILDQIDLQVRSAQAGLEREVAGLRARGDHRGAETWLRVARENPLTEVLRAPADPEVDPWAGSPGAPKRRVVIT